MKQCQLLTQAQLLLKMLDRCLLLLVFHTAGKNSLSGKVPGQTAYIKKDPLWMPYEHAHLQSLSQKHAGPSEGAFMGDLALQHLSRGPQQIVGQSWVGLCWKKKATYMWPGTVLTEDLPLKTQLLLKDISFGALEATGPLSKISP